MATATKETLWYVTMRPPKGSAQKTEDGRQLERRITLTAGSEDDARYAADTQAREIAAADGSDRYEVVSVEKAA